MTDVQNSEAKTEDISADTSNKNGRENTNTQIPHADNVNEEKQLCDGAACPAVQNKKILSLKEGLADLDKILASLQGLCIASPCPFSQKSTFRDKSNFNQYLIKSGRNINENIKASSDLTEHCGGQTCPVAVGKSIKKNPLVFESVVTSDNKYTSDPVSANHYDSKYKYPSKKIDWNLKEQEPCGGYTCPYTSTNVQKSATASYKFPTDNNAQHSTGYNRNQNIPKDGFANQVLDCGQPSCPFSKIAQTNVLTGMATGIFPYGNQTNMESKRYHCGSPSCTNLDPSSMVYTHYYANDYGFVQESSRPYCGSACPYDYLSSINNKYPSKLASNYPTFDCSNFSGSQPCPYLSKQNERNIRKLGDNIEEGICRTDKNHSCDHPDVEKCGSPDCKITQKNINLNHFDFCEDCGGVKAEQIITEISKSHVENKEENIALLKIDEIQEKKMDEKLSNLVANKTDDITKESTDKNENVVDEESTTKMVNKKSTKEKIVLYTYPGVQIGHKDCLLDKKPVPGNMGWLWDIMPEGNIELWRGYKPGAISRTVHKIMKAHKKSLNILDSSSDVIRKKKSKTKAFKPEDLKHCIELKKKDGDVFITMNPVRDPKTIGPAESPFMDVTPMQFKIEKEKKEKENEEAYCPCDETSVKTYPSSKSSELEFLFSPPAALPPMMAKKKKIMQEIDTQYDVNDLPIEFRASSKAITEKKGGGKKGKKDGKSNKDDKGKKEVKGKQETKDKKDAKGKKEAKGKKK